MHFIQIMRRQNLMFRDVLYVPTIQKFREKITYLRGPLPSLLH